MTQALTGIVLAGVVAACWVLGRPKRNILRSTDASAIAAINRSQMELVIPAREGDAMGQASAQTVQLPAAHDCLLYTSPSPRDRTRSRMPSSA